MKTSRESENIIRNNNSLSAQLFLSAAVCSSLLIAFSYILDLIFLGKSGSLQDSNAVSSLLSGLGTLIIKFSFVFVSAGIVLQKREFDGLPCAIIGSLLISQGCTFGNISGTLSGISGIFGSIFAGYFALTSLKVCRRIISVKKNNVILKQISLILPIVITALGVLSVNSLGAYLNSLSTSLLKNLADSRTILLPIIIGIFTVIDGGGPLSLCAYIFGSTSIIAEEPQVMAAVIGAGMIPSLSAVLFAYIYKERLEAFEIKGAYQGLFPALLGLPQVSYLFYITRKLRFIIPCMVGGSLTALLSVMLGCSSASTEKGFLSIGSFSKPLFLILCIIFGVIITTALMSITIKTYNAKASENSEVTDSKNDVIPNTAQA
ncbi:MAG: hypothetical protein E7566_01345 [Ruminococcaceae bacterium]|nr:hypothetical protein [Oscillospiraceae bacterium]